MFIGPRRSICMIILIVAGVMVITAVALAQSQRDSQRRERLRQWLRDRRQQAAPAVEGTIDPATSDLYKLAAGPHAIDAVTDYHLKLPGHELPLRITYPSEGGPWPLIVFCHGALGSKDSQKPLRQHWATHGYVVIQPTFGDSLENLTAEQRRHVRSVGELVNSQYVKSQWDDRPREVSALLDRLPQLIDALPALAGRIDTRRIGVGGHSFGAHTTMLLAGLRLPRALGDGDSPAPFRDDRPVAFIMISPQGTTRAINAESYRGFDRPTLMITGDNDGTPMRGREDKAGAWRRQAFDHAPDGPRYLLWIDGAHHGFGGITGTTRWAGAGPANPDHVYIVKSVTLAMWDAYLKNDTAAAAYLVSGKLAEVTHHAAHIENKLKQ